MKMRMKNSISNIIAVVLAAVLCGCQKEPGKVVLPDEGPEMTDIAIRWNPSVKEANTKALVGAADTEGQAKSGFITLRDACDDTKATRNSVGFWTDMIYRDENGKEQHRYDVFNTNGQEAKLFFDPDFRYEDSDPMGAWTYLEDATSSIQYWASGASYNFVAYYPQKMSEYVLDASSSSSVNTFVLSYNTHIVQEDLMVAYNSVHTDDPILHKPTIYRERDKSSDNTFVYHEASGLSGFRNEAEFQLDDFIPLHFEHTLAAVKFQFMFESEDNDELVECWLQNHPGNGLHTVGTLVFGVGSREEEKKDMTFADEKARLEYEHKEKDDFSWTSYFTAFDDMKMYNWRIEPDITDAYGNPAWSEGRGLSIEKFNKDTENYTVPYVSVYPDTGNPIDLGEKTEIFAGHGGWIMMIPQTSPGNVEFCYRLRKSYDEHTVLHIPAFTGTDKDGNSYDFNGESGMTEEQKQAARASYNHYLPGYLYTYTINIARSQSYINISIAPWDKIYSNTDIIF